MRIELGNEMYYPSNSQVDAGRKDATPIEKNAISQQQREVATEVNISQNKEEQEHEVIQAIEKANKQIKVFDRKLEFSIHDKTKEIMVKVINTTDDSIVREIPSEKVLDMVAKLWEMSGIFVDEKR